ncbi:DsbA family oxidoreductase [Sporosarcina sp. PTS2304]|uniref:DsbA family oxidoreductase n=1 Tax=Sporosarcina sp. PTS2304 TaxID=2283194 RepID=UPI000E0CCF1B|nr:DsbA family oxidoreductase [Sporosarcina sp. PTS2304]AXI00326.1 DsbA family oxidoreductase [Sporosarcina sp. PTS2304]
MKIEVWSDYVCPFCYMGKRRLEEALAEVNVTEPVEMEFKAYMLDPNTPVASGQSFLEGMAKKFNVSESEAEYMMKNIESQAQTVGLHYQMKKMKTSNTLDAHRLTKFAAVQGKGEQVAELLMHSHFIEGEHIDTEEVLVAIAEEAGLDTAQTKEMLQSDDFTEKVHADMQQAREMGIKSVPFFLFNKKYAVSGSQSKEAFIEALTKVAEEEVAE